MTTTDTMDPPDLATPGPDPASAPRRIPAGARISPRQTAANALTLAWRSLAQLRHSPEKLLDVVLMPVVFLVLFLYVFGGAITGSTHGYLELLLPGLFAQMAVFATMSLGTALAEDIHKGVFDRFRSLPIARSTPLIGAVLGDTARFIAVMVMLTGFGTALGFRFHTGPLQILAAYGLAYVFYLAFCWVSVLIGLIAPSPQSVQGFAFIYTMPLTFGSSVLMPNVSSEPGWLQAWVKVNPVTDLADAVRAAVLPRG